MLNVVDMIHASFVCCIILYCEVNNMLFCHCIVAENRDDLQVLQPRRNRLATLTENIKSWEEDLSHPQIK